MPDDMYRYRHERNMALLAGRIERILNEIARQLTGPVSRVTPGTERERWLLSIRREIDEVLAGMQKSLKAITEESVINAWNLANDKNNRLVDSYLDKKSTVNSQVLSSMNQLNLGIMNRFLARADSGKMVLSKSVWQIAAGFQEQLELYVGAGITQGKSAAGISRDIRALLKEPNMLFRRVRNEDGNLVLSAPARDYHPGQGVYRSSYKNALRLARTETNIAYHLSDSERRAQIPFITGVRVVLSGAHPRYDICDSLQGEYPKGFIFSGWHPQCICHTETILASREDFRAYLRDGKPIPAEAFRREIPRAARAYLVEKDAALKKSGLYWIKDNFDNDWKLKPGVVRTRSRNKPGGA
ncbi:MAG: hypothetical protein RBT43_06755, partial [bacterium]|nr:hypothetical protein [bacterium]